MSPPRSGQPARGAFFVHIMKTGGVALTNALRRQLGPEAVYPPVSEMGVRQAKVNTGHLLGLSAEQRQRYLGYSVHMPAWMAREVAPDFVTATILREPIARTLSHLNQISAVDWAPDRVEELWDDARWRHRLADYQTRLFTVDDDADLERGPNGGGTRRSRRQRQELLEVRRHFTEGSAESMDGLLRPFFATGVSSDSPPRPNSLPEAVATLRGFDVVGITEDLGRVGRRLGQAMGAEPLRPGRDNVAAHRPSVPRSFLRRLEADLQMDLELYELACQLAVGSAG